MNAQTLILVAGRVLLALLFVLGGVNKVLQQEAVLAQMAKFNVPGELLPAVIGLEIGGGAAILFGFQLRYSAGALAVFCLLTAAIFHSNFAVPAELTQFFKDLALAGALMVIAMASFDGGRSAQKT